MNHSSAWFEGTLLSELFPQMARDASSSICSSIAVLGVTTLFFTLVTAKILPSFHHLFLDTRGWSHRLFGGFHFGLLLLGAVLCWIEATASENRTAESNDNSIILYTTLSNLYLSNKANATLWYDAILGCSGVITTLTAAKDFPHRLVRNKPGRSGSLHEEAIVTQAEMIEHSFYQGLNLLQSLYLHFIYRLNAYCESEHVTEANYTRITTRETNVEHPLRNPSSWVMMCSRIFFLWVATAPWLVRHRFPVHGFSENWSKGSRNNVGKSKEVAAMTKSVNTNSESLRKQDGGRTSSDCDAKIGGEILLYRIKKAQYLFYKHVILHGLNISVALGYAANQSNSLAIPYGIYWRIFWLLLNTSYVMEFFLQTLVKRKVLSQGYMIVLQKTLMLAASGSAIKVLFGDDTQRAIVRPEVCLLSLTLNFVHRHHDVFNTIWVALMFCLVNLFLF